MSVEQQWDHQRDLAKHSWPAAEVSTQDDPDVPGLTGYVITGFTAQDVQAEINRIRSIPGEGHFNRPQRVGARFVSSGWLRRTVLS